MDDAVPIMTSRGSFSIDEWCERHHVCRATFYNMQKRGEGPDILRIGRSVRISADADARWVAQREGVAGNGSAELPAERPHKTRVMINTD
jgi:hypothetical protein